MMLDFTEDLHVHSIFSDGRGTLARNIEAARARGLWRLGCVDHVRRDTPWVPDFTAAVRKARRANPDIELLCGVETKMLDEDGTLDLPADLAGVDRVYVADHRLPIGGRCLGLGEARRALADGSLDADRVVAALVGATRRAMERQPRVVIAHLFSILPKLRIREEVVPDAAIAELARVAAQTGAWLEVDERWRSPGPRVAELFSIAGVPVVASSDAHRPQDIGRYPWAWSTFGGAERWSA